MSKRVSGVSGSRKPFRVLVVAPTSFFSDYGCSVRILEEVRALQQLGQRVTVCTYRKGQDVAGLEIRRTPRIPFRASREVGSSLHKLAFDFLLFWTVLFAALRARPDVLHGHMHEGALIALVVGCLLRLPVVFDFQGSLTGEMMDHKFLRRTSIFYRPLHWIEKMVDRLSPMVLTSSHNARERLISEFGCLPERVQTLPDGVNGATFCPLGEEERAALPVRRRVLGIPPGRRVVAYLGLLADYQGTDHLLRAAAELVRRKGDVHFLIMGFPSVDHYRNMARQLGIAAHTTFTGKVPYSQARDLLALGDIAVAPKQSATEGVGKILNYMAMGLPTVAFDTPVSREYLGDQGIYAQPGDPVSLAEALHLALTDRRATQRSAALRRVATETYTWERSAQIILSAYDRVCG